MRVQSHMYDFGEVDDLELLDRIIEGLANGAVMATRVWLQAQPEAPRDVFNTYCNPRPYAGDPRIQHVPIAAQATGPGTCLEIAIHEAAWLQANGEDLWDRVWIRIVRDNPEQYAHALVMIQHEDGSETLTNPTSFLLEENTP